MLRRRDEDPPPGGDPGDGQAGEPADGPTASDPTAGGVATLARPAAKSPARVLAGGGAQLRGVLVPEFGDLTQLATANLAARYHDPLGRRRRGSALRRSTRTRSTTPRPR
jgi:hypothetical protein